MINATVINNAIESVVTECITRAVRARDTETLVACIPTLWGQFGAYFIQCHSHWPHAIGSRWTLRRNRREVLIVWWEEDRDGRSWYADWADSARAESAFQTQRARRREEQSAYLEALTAVAVRVACGVPPQHREGCEGGVYVDPHSGIHVSARGAQRRARSFRVLARDTRWGHYALDTDRRHYGARY